MVKIAIEIYRRRYSLLHPLTKSHRTQLFICLHKKMPHRNILIPTQKIILLLIFDTTVFLQLYVTNDIRLLYAHKYCEMFTASTPFFVSWHDFNANGKCGRTDPTHLSYQ